jgi:Ion channel
MLSVLAIAVVLVAMTVAVHAYGLSFLLPMLARARAAPPTGHWPITSLLVRIALFLVAIHVIEITIWALFYWWEGCLTGAESAFYFSGVTYTTLGYGDVVLIKPWRMLGPIEALTGMLMGALSAGVFFATVSRIYAGQLAEGRDEETR